MRRAFNDSLRALQAFIAAHEACVIEGCYADLVAAALPHSTEFRFLNPGVETCVARCLARQWEPDKFGSKAGQDTVLAGLVARVREYPTRGDECGLRRHRAVFDGFAGTKIEITRQGDR